MKLIVAVNNLNYIGKNGEMLWKSSTDFKHFKQMTIGSTLIVGSVTYEECMGGKDLPKRDTVIIGTNYKNLLDGIKAALKYSESKENKDIWVIGGSMIYKALLPLCTEIHISHINDNSVGDRSFTIPEDYKGKVFNYNFEVNE